jgi:hypothetical protein
MIGKDFERAFRFGLRLPLRYRSKAGTQWREGRTENISRSGVLFRTDDVLDVDTRLEMNFVLPVGSNPPLIVCRGHVVRTVLPKGREAMPGFAVTIAAFRFVRGRLAKST